MDSLIEYNRETEAVNFIKKHLKDKNVFVGFSGGKDSIVTAELMKRSKVNHQLYYSFTGLDHPSVVKFIKKQYPDCIFLKPKKTFWKELSTKCPPSPIIRWCCYCLKKEASWKIPLNSRVMGIRKEESNKRAAYGMINYFKKLNHTHYYPIYHWKEYHIWDFINKNNLPYPSIYDEGFGRTGCIICPFHSEKTGKLQLKYRKKYSRFFKKWEKEISKLSYKRISQGKIMHYKTPEKYLEAWYKNNLARWYKNNKKIKSEKGLF